MCLDNLEQLSQRVRNMIEIKKELDQLTTSKEGDRQPALRRITDEEYGAVLALRLAQEKFAAEKLGWVEKEKDDGEAEADREQLALTDSSVAG